MFFLLPSVLTELYLSRFTASIKIDINHFTRSHRLRAKVQAISKLHFTNRLFIDPSSNMALSMATKRGLQAAVIRRSAGVTSTQVRSHHPNPFDPKTTRGWKAALKVSNDKQILEVD
jgi:hypothetical protein